MEIIMEIKVALVSLACPVEVGYDQALNLLNETDKTMKKEGVTCENTGVVMHDLDTVRQAAEKLKGTDADVLMISIATWSEDHHLLDLLSYPEFHLVISSELIAEICDVFSRPKLAKYYSAENIHMLLKYMKEFSLSFELGEIPSRCRDPKDDYLLELALVSDADFLITGDKDFC